jgi:hypothetical protein
MFKPRPFLFILLLLNYYLVSCKREVTDLPLDLSPVLSFEKNPYSNWEIGYSLDTSLNPEKFRRSVFTNTSTLIGMWHPGAGSTLYYPYTGQNRDSVSILDISTQWALRTRQIAMEGSNSGQYSLLRFLTPSPGTYRIKVTFEGIHFGLSSTDVHVLLNNTRLYDDLIEGYGGDPTFHPIIGTRPTITYEDLLTLVPGDIITIAVGYGPNKNHFNDTTGLLIILVKQ